MVNWRKILHVEIERALAPLHVEDDAPEPIEVKPSEPIVLVDPYVTPRAVFDDIMAEVAAMGAPALSWLGWRGRRPRWNPAGLAPTMVVLELTDGMVRHG